jgi:caffeoyl-CoA O-methyltransferase
MKKFAETPEVALQNYLDRVFTPEDKALREIRERSEKEGLPAIQVGLMDSLHLEVITRAIGAKKAVEIGSLGGYSGTAICRGLAPGGKLYCFEFEPKHAEVMRESFKKTDFEKQTEIFVGPALENLSKIESQGPFDLVFCDADKVNYPGYLDWAAKNLRVGGLLIGDNTLGWGMIARESSDEFDDKEQELSIRGLQKFNQAAAQGGRFRATLLPTGEGLTLAVKIC